MESFDRVYRKQYAADLADGQLYQDFIYELLSRHGINTVAYGSKLFQQLKGENKAGIEIKHDAKREKTGNLYIEIAERSNPRFNYTPGGIYRDAVEYVIGDYTIVYRMAVSTLRQLHASGKYREFEIPLKTSRGFLLPEPTAARWATVVYTPNCSEEMKRLVAASVEDRVQAREEMRQLQMAMKCIWQGSLFE